MGGRGKGNRLDVLETDLKYISFDLYAGRSSIVWGVYGYTAREYGTAAGARGTGFTGLYLFNFLCIYFKNYDPTAYVDAISILIN